MYIHVLVHVALLTFQYIFKSISGGLSINGCNVRQSGYRYSTAKHTGLVAILDLSIKQGFHVK